MASKEILGKDIVTDEDIWRLEREGAFAKLKVIAAAGGGGGVGGHRGRHRRGPPSQQPPSVAGSTGAQLDRPSRSPSRPLPGSAPTGPK